MSFVHSEGGGGGPKDIMSPRGRALPKRGQSMWAHKQKQERILTHENTSHPSNIKKTGTPLGLLPIHTWFRSITGP